MSVLICKRRFEHGAVDSSHSFPVNVLESEKEYKIKVFIPGIPKDQIELNLQEHNLRISFERKKEEMQHLRTEVPSGRFERVFHLPGDADGQMSANMTDGVLVVSIQKTQPTKIRIE